MATSQRGQRGQGKTPTRPIRIDPALWDAFGEAAARHDTDRSQLLRDFMAWYAREPGAKLPKRPELNPQSEPLNPQ